jgi:hypothetical protein
LNAPSHAAAPPPFDFRSARFERDASWLARISGCALWRCRQELFIADGQTSDALLALGVTPLPPADGLLLH